MSDIKIIAERSDIVAIADAVRSKTGTTNEMTIGGIINGINNISVGSSEGGGVIFEEPIQDGNTLTITQVYEPTLNGNTVVIDPYDMLQAIVDSLNSCAYLFNDYSGDNVDYIFKLDTSNVTDMQHMFNNCSNLTTIPQLDTGNVTDMQYMFYSCSNLTTIPQLDTSNVTYMQHMFGDCSNLTTIPQLDTGNVTNMRSMFDSCSNLTTIPQLDTSNVTNMYQMFDSCSNLTTIPQLDTSNVTLTYWMFHSCSNLTTIDLTFYPNTSSAENVSRMFGSCSSLETVIFRNFGSNYALNTNTFENCSNLTSIYVPDNMVSTLKTATNWSTHSSKIKALSTYKG